MNILSYLDKTAVAQGYVSGYSMHIPKRSEDAIRQGMSHLLTVKAIFEQVNLSSDLLTKSYNMLRTQYPNVKLLIGLRVGISISSTALIALAYAGVFHQLGWLTIAIPLAQSCVPEKYRAWIPEITPLKERVLNFFTEHTGDVAQVAAVVSQVALFALGARQEAVAGLITMGVGYLDRRGVLPLSVSKFINERLLVVSYVAMFTLSGSLFSKFIASIYIISNVNCLNILSVGIMRNGADFIVRKIAERKGCLYPSMKEVETVPTPHSKPKVSKESLENPQALSELEVEVAPSHVAIPVTRTNETCLYDYSKLVPIFDDAFAELTDGKFRVMGAKLFDDDRFFKEHCRQIKDSVTKDNLKSWLTPMWIAYQIRDIYKNRSGSTQLWSQLRFLSYAGLNKTSIDKWIDANYELINRTLSENSISKDSLKSLLTPAWIKQHLQEADPREMPQLPSWSGLTTVLSVMTDGKNIDTWVNDNYEQVKGGLETSNPTDVQKSLARYCSNFDREEMRAWTRKQLELFIQNMTGKKIPKGDLTTFDEVKKKAAIVNNHIHDLYNKVNDKKLPEEVRTEARLELETMLLRLAVEAGDYCVTGLTRGINEAYNSITQSEGSILQQILTELMRLRETLFQQVYSGMYPPGQMNMLDRAKADVHMYNDFKRKFGLGLGLNESDSTSDTALISDPTLRSGNGIMVLYPVARIGWWSDYKRKQKKPIGTFNVFETMQSAIANNGIKGYLGLIKSFAVDMWVQRFNNFAYTHKAILNHLQSLFDQQLLTRELYNSWWEDHLTKRGFSVEERVDIMSNLFDVDPDLTINPPRLTINPHYLKVMLVESGILEVA